MKPFILDLPPIYRGCHYLPIIFKWKDAMGDPMTLSGWTPYCATKHFSLNAVVINPTTGTTRISLTRFQSADLKLGVEEWDWVWENHFGPSITGPYLAGTIEIKEPLAHLERPE